AVVRDGVVEEASAGGSDDDVLLAILALIGHGSGFGGAAEFHGPEFLAVLGVEGAEAGVVGGGHEYESSGGGDGAAVAGAAGVLLAGGEAVGYAEGDPPGELAGVDVDGG